MGDTLTLEAFLVDWSADSVFYGRQGILSILCDHDTTLVTVGTLALHDFEPDPGAASIMEAILRASRTSIGDQKCTGFHLRADASVPMCRLSFFDGRLTGMRWLAVREDDR